MTIGPLVAATLIVAFVAIRWRLLPARLRIAAGVAAAALAAWGAGLVQPPSLETIATDVGAQLGAYTYVLVGILAALETGAGVGLLAPGELAVVVGGVTAGQGHTQLALLIAVVWACALTGDLLSYGLGRRLGRTFLERHGPVVRLTPDRLAQVERFLGRHGGKTIILGRFIGVVRAVAPFVAGSSRMPARRFIPATLVASGLWSVTFATLGYLFWESFDQAAAIAKDGTFALLAVVGIATVAVIAHRQRRRPRLDSSR